MYWNVQKPFNQDKPVIGSMYFNAEKTVVISRDNVGLNSEGIKAVPAGLFLANVGGVDRFLPRDVLQTAVTNGAGDTNLEVTMPEVFQAGDVIYQVEPKGLITLANTWAAGDTVTIRFSEPSLGVNLQYTHTQVGADLNALDDELVTALNLATNPLSEYARFEVGSAGEVVVFSKGLEFEMSVSAVTAGDGTATVTTQLDSAPVMVGTIASVDHANNTVVLSSATAIDLAEGARIGTLTNEIYGVYNHSIDFTDKSQCYAKAIDRADRVYIASLPYYDHQIKATFPRMKFV